MLFKDTLTITEVIGVQHRIIKSDEYVRTWKESVFACLKVQLSIRPKYLQNTSTARSDNAERNYHFPASGRNCYIIDNFILFLWSEIWLVSGRACSTWRKVMRFQPQAGKWHLGTNLSANALYKVLPLKYHAQFLYFLLVFITQKYHNKLGCKRLEQM
jgi:hypothetical protein